MMWRPSLPGAWLLVACAGCTGADTTDAVREPTSATTPVETQPTPMSTTDGPEYFFAVAAQTGVEHCPDGHSSEWLDIQPTLGWTPTSGAATTDLDALMDLPVLARGSAGPAPARAPLGVEPIPCPLMQMRSDWVSTPRGIRSQRTSPSAAGHFLLSSVRRLDELAITVDGDRITASFANPLPFALTGVRLSVHYEGCYGKPGTTSLESKQTTLGPGEILTHEFPRIAEYDQPGPRKGGPAAREHLAAALVLEIGGSEGPNEARVWADLDVSLRKLGFAFECD